MNDDECGLHQDYEKWLEPPHGPSASADPEVGCTMIPEKEACPERSDRSADAHKKHQLMGREMVVAVTNRRLDGFA